MRVKKTVYFFCQTNCSHTGDQAEPVAEQDEYKDGSKKPKCFAGQLGSEDAFEKADQAFDDPFDKVLKAGWHQLRLIGGDLRHEYKAKSHAPSDHHRVRDGEGVDLRQDYCIWGQPVMPAFVAMVIAVCIYGGFS